MVSSAYNTQNLWNDVPSVYNIALSRLNTVRFSRSAIEFSRGVVASTRTPCLLKSSSVFLVRN